MRNTFFYSSQKNSLNQRASTYDLAITLAENALCRIIIVCYCENRILSPKYVLPFSREYTVILSLNENENCYNFAMMCRADVNAARL